MKRLFLFANPGIPWLACLLLATLFPRIPGVRHCDLLLMDAQARWTRQLHPRPAPGPEVVVVGMDETTLEALPEPLALFHRPLGAFLEAMAQARPLAVGVDGVLPERSMEALLPGSDFQLARGLLALRNQGVPLVLGRGILGGGRLRRLHPPLEALAGEGGLGLLLAPLDPDGTARRFQPRLGEPSGPPSAQAGPGEAFAARLAKACGHGAPEGYVDFSLGPPFQPIPLEQVLAWRASGRTDLLQARFQGRVVLLGTTLPFEDRLRLPVSLEAGAPSGSREAPGVLLHAQTLRTLLGDRIIRPLPGWFQGLLALSGALAGLALARSKGGGAGILALGAAALAALPLGIQAGRFIPPLACAGPGLGTWLALRAAERIQDRRSRRQAEASLRDQAAFLACLSHEIRTPLNGVLGLAHLGQRQGSASARGACLARIEEAGRGLVDVLDQVLELSRLGAGPLELERIPFEPAALLKRLGDLFGAQASLQGLGFHLRLDPAVPPALLGDPLRLGQVLVNLTANALKFTDKGRVEVRILPGGGDAGGPRLRFEVEDTGIGLDPAAQRRLFQPFAQADPSTPRRFGGSGLGLSIASRLVEAMGGVLEVESEPGRGSTFHFQAPFPLAPRALGSLRNRRILLVEDHPINQEVASAFLRAAGAEVTLAATGPAGVRSALEAPPDLVLMDLQLPGLDGIQASRRILAQRPELPILAMTADASPALRAACLEAGMLSVLLKPLDPETFLDSLRPWLPPPAGETGAPPFRAPGNPPFLALADPGPAGLNLGSALGRLGGNRDLLAELLRRFPGSHREDPLRLRECLDRGDLGAARSLLHRLRGAAASLGAEVLSRACLELEEALRGQASLDLAPFERALEDLLEACPQAILSLSPP